MRKSLKMKQMPLVIFTQIRKSLWIKSKISPIRIFRRFWTVGSESTPLVYCHQRRVQKSACVSPCYRLFEVKGWLLRRTIVGEQLTQRLRGQRHRLVGGAASPTVRPGQEVVWATLSFPPSLFMPKKIIMTWFTVIWGQHFSLFWPVKTMFFWW